MLTSAQVRAARALLKIGVRELASIAEVTPATVTRFEGGKGVQTATLQKLQAASGDRWCAVHS